MLDLSLVNSLLNNFSITGLGLNFLDIIILVVVLFYIYEGFALGFVSALFDFISFVLSFILGVKLYGFLGTFIFDSFSIPIGFSNAIGFFIVASVFEIIFNILFRKALTYFSGRIRDVKFADFLKNINKYLGFLPGLASAIVLLSFFLTLIVSLPLSPILKRSVSSSRIGSVLVSKTAGFEKDINDVFGQAVNDTLNFLTIEPQSNEFVSLKFKTDNFSEDPIAEKQMFDAVNKQRVSNGQEVLIFDEKIRDVAREHSKDMLRRGYFSHFTPEKLSPFDRISIADIPFGYAGENLALAPSTELAMQGLMNSPGHRANILSSNFKKIGIGAIDGGIYGIMFTQNFTD